VLYSENRTDFRDDPTDDAEDVEEHVDVDDDDDDIDANGESGAGETHCGGGKLIVSVGDVGRGSIMMASWSSLCWSS
jgi:hypothetical protein